MTTATQTLSRSRVAPALLALVAGAMLVFLAGLAQSATLHDAAHDLRHGTGFPCH